MKDGDNSTGSRPVAKSRKSFLDFFSSRTSFVNEGKSSIVNNKENDLTESSSVDRWREQRRPCSFGWSRRGLRQQFFALQNSQLPPWTKLGLQWYLFSSSHPVPVSRRSVVSNISATFSPWAETVARNNWGTQLPCVLSILSSGKSSCDNFIYCFNVHLFCFLFFFKSQMQELVDNLHLLLTSRTTNEQRERSTVT